MWCSNDREAKIIIEAHDDIAEGVPEGWSIDRAVILVELGQLPGGFKPGFRCLGRKHTGHIEKGKSPRMVCDLVSRRNVLGGGHLRLRPISSKFTGE